MWKKAILVGIIILFIGAGITPSICGKTEKIDVMQDDKIVLIAPSSRGFIQDLIDSASDGDTINIPSGTYYENIVIDKSITLIGEDKETTFILGDESQDGVIVRISADDVSISGFTIQPNSGEPAGIFVNKNYVYPDYWNIEIIENVTIFNNIIKDTGTCIFGIRLNNGNIYENIIGHSSGSGITLFISSDNSIENNVISDCAYRGIKIDGLWSPYRIRNYLNPVSENNVISNNIISSNRWGIQLSGGPVNTVISDNEITENHGSHPGHDGFGIFINQASKTQVIRNNFIDNSINAYFTATCVVRYPQFLKNSWDNNYWGEPKSNPVKIDGAFYLIPFPRLPISISFPSYEFNFKELSWASFDRHPADAPYDV